MDFEKVWDVISVCWPAKMLVSSLITLGTFLLGDIQAAFYALWVLVFIDLITKWAAISRQTLLDEGVDSTIWYGFYRAWHVGSLNSRTMREKFATKLFAYFILIVVANLTSKIIPSMILFGADWSKAPGGFVYSFLAATEMMSIVENLIEMGMDGLKPLAVWASKKRDQMTGGK